MYDVKRKTIYSGNPASFTAQSGDSIGSIIASITPVQSGSGDPSPSNVRPITGWTGANIYVSPTQDQQDATVYNVDWTSAAGTVYGGTLNVVTGKLTVTKAKIAFGNVSTLSWTKSTSYPGGFYCSWTGWAGSIENNYNVTFKENKPFICSHAKSVADIADYVSGTCFSDGSCNIRVMNPSTTVDQWKDYLTTQYSTGTPVEICGELETPIIYQLTGQQVTALVGQNNVWSNFGTTTTVSVLSESNFHTLSIEDSPKTRCRIYFIGDGVDCTDDNDVQTNGTLLVGAVGDTDSNGRIGQDGIKFTEYDNPEYNVTIGRAVSSQVEMTLLNTDGALDNFGYGRCKIYLDVYDSANSTWLACPMGVYIIDLPTRRKSQLIHAFGYDQMQKLDGICDTWWGGLNFSGGLTLLQIVNSMASQTGVSVSAATATAIVNSSVTYTAAPFDCVETTYREVLELIAEATGTVARFDRDGALDLKWFGAAQIGGNTVEIDTDTIGNQCLSIDLAEYQVAAIDLLKVKIAEDDVGVTVGSGTNQYTILDNLFLDGSVATITTRATAIYNRLNALGAYKPIQSKLIWDWSIEAGDIIDITRDSTTYTTPIFQQTMTWRGGYVVSELVNSGDNVRPVPNYDERSTYRMQSEMSAKVGDNEIISKINQSPEAITIQASKVNLTGYVTFTNLSTPGQTTIDGGNLTTGTISADRIAAGSLSIGKLDTATQNTINTAASNASTALSDAAAAQSTANSANSQEQLIFISRTSGTTTQSATTTWVTNTTGNQNTWTIKRPTYNSSYPVLFVATQRKNVAGTVTCTTPQIDNTTTVIDGGHITTGTIDASVVSVTNLNASNITSGTMSANKISGGSIDASNVTITNLNASNITSGSLSANYIQGGTMTVGGLNDTNGYIRILDSTGNYAGGVGASGITLQGEEPYSGLSHVIYNAIFPYGYSLRDQTTQNQLINVDVQIPSATDEYAKYYIQGYDSGTQVSRVEFSAYPYNNGAYLILQGPNGLIRLNSDGTYAGDLTINYGGNLTIKGGVLDVVDRRCYATLSSAGWYRVCKTADVSGTIIDFSICRPYGSAPAEAHRISFYVVGGGKSAFLNETSDTNTLFVDKIRCTYGGGFIYFDVHYNSSASNEVLVYFDVYGKGQANGTSVSMGLTSVAASPSGETVLTEFSFAANTYYHDDNTTSGVRHIVDRRGDIVTVTIKSAGSGINCPAGQYTTVYTLPSELAPSGSVYTVVEPYGGNNIIGGMIDTSGTIQLYPVLSSTSYYRFTLTYTI